MMEYTSLAKRLGLTWQDGLQTRTWTHNLSANFRCVLCGERDSMDCVSTTLFDGHEQLGDLCRSCVKAGPRGAAPAARAHADHLCDEADDLREVASQLDRIDPARWSLPVEQDLAHEQLFRDLSRYEDERNTEEAQP